MGSRQDDVVEAIRQCRSSFVLQVEWDIHNPRREVWPEVLLDLAEGRSEPLDRHVRGDFQRQLDRAGLLGAPDWIGINNRRPSQPNRDRGGRSP